jgi:rubredoxin
MPRYALITTLDNVWAVRSDDLGPIIERRADLTASGVPSAIVEVIAWEDQPSPTPSRRRWVCGECGLAYRPSDDPPCRACGAEMLVRDDPTPDEPDRLPPSTRFHD